MFLLYLCFFLYGTVFGLDCLESSESEECANYQLSDLQSTDSIDKLCKAMPNMNACIIKNSCKSTTEECSPFRFLQSICLDMPRMKDCLIFNTLCKPGSQIEQCKQTKLSLPTSKETKAEISSICNEMNMIGCECISIQSCNLENYTFLCKQMPEMKQCAGYNTLCETYPLLSFCNQSPVVPTMKMFFHFGINDYLLFEFIVPSTTFEYLLALIVCFSIALFYEYLLVVTENYKVFWKSLGAGKDGLLGDHKNAAVDRSRFALLWTPLQIRVGKSLFRMATMFFAYLCMLIAMTFNIGLFMAILLGFGVGRFFFSELDFEQNNKEHCC
jgi:copper transporter 1